MPVGSPAIAPKVPAPSVPTPAVSREPATETLEAFIDARDVCVFYGKYQAIQHVSMAIPRNNVVAMIGPSGCGKSTFLRSINRLNDLIPGCRIEGELAIGGENIYADGVDLVALRRRVGLVFQKPNPFPKSIYDNVAFGPRLQGIRSRSALDPIVEKTLRQAAIWDEVKDRLNTSALGLSGGQQQRLCIARALATRPEVLLMDEPCSALDPIATAKVEDLIDELKREYTIVIVTHNLQQAARVSDRTAFFLHGEIDRVRGDQRDVHQPRPEADRGLHHRKIWLINKFSRRAMPAAFCRTVGFRSCPITSSMFWTSCAAASGG